MEYRLDFRDVARLLHPAPCMGMQSPGVLGVTRMGKAGTLYKGSLQALAAALPQGFVNACAGPDA